MALLDSFLNKPKANFEKQCSDFTIFDKNDLTTTKKVKAIIDIGNNSIQFFGDSKSVLSLVSNTFLYDKNKQILLIDVNTLTENEDQFVDGTKTFTYKTTIAKFEYKSFILQ